MSPVQNLLHWGNKHHPWWFVFLRIALGICLSAKGIFFMNNATVLKEILTGSPLSHDPGWLLIFITWMNLLGGFLLIVGLQTRFVALLEIPVVVGAISFISTQWGSFYTPFTELGLAIISLVLLVFFVIEGSGPISLDNYFYKNRDDSAAGTRLP